MHELDCLLLFGLLCLSSLNSWMTHLLFRLDPTHTELTTKLQSNTSSITYKGSDHFYFFVLMGVSGLKELIEKACAEGASVDDVLKLNGVCKVIPIDISNVMYSLKYCIEPGSPMWITRAVTCLRRLKQLFKRPLIVFDGEVPNWKIVAASRLKQRVANKRKHSQEQNEHDALEARKQRFLLWKAKQSQRSASVNDARASESATHDHPPALEERSNAHVTQEQTKQKIVPAASSSRNDAYALHTNVSNMHVHNEAPDAVVAEVGATNESTPESSCMNVAQVPSNMFAEYAKDVHEEKTEQPSATQTQLSKAPTLAVADAAAAMNTAAYAPFAVDDNFSAEEIAAFESWNETAAHHQDELQKQELAKAARSDIEVPPEDYVIMKALCRIERIEYVQARFEADNVFRECTRMNLSRCIISQDRDGLMQGAPVLVHMTYNTFRTCDATTKVFKIYQLDKILKHVKVNQERFVEYCFVLGCDYSYGLFGIKSGRIAKAFADYKSLENLVLRYPAKPKDPEKLQQWNDFLTTYKYAVTNAIYTKWDDFELLSDEKLLTSDNYDITNYKWHKEVQPMSREECAKKSMMSVHKYSLQSGSAIAGSAETPASSLKVMMENMLKQAGVTVCKVDMSGTSHSAASVAVDDSDVQLIDEHKPKEDKNIHQAATAGADVQKSSATGTSDVVAAVSASSKSAASRSKYASVECAICTDTSHVTNPCETCGHEQCLQCAKGHTSCKPCCACANKYRREAYDDVRNKAKTKHHRVEEMRKRLENIRTIEALYKEFGVLGHEGSSAAASGASFSSIAASSSSRQGSFGRADIPYSAPKLSAALASKYKRQKCGAHTSSTSVIDITGQHFNIAHANNANASLSANVSSEQCRTNGTGTQSAPILISDITKAHAGGHAPIVIDDAAPAIKQT
jgi:5'-3' exonuclease